MAAVSTSIEDTLLHAEFMEFLKKRITENLRVELMKAAEAEVENVVKLATKDLEVVVQGLIDRSNNTFLLKSIVSYKKP